MRRSRSDDNQPEIVAALRQAGCTVQNLNNVGDGCPDILVGHRQINLLLEIKDGSKAKSQQKLTPDQVEWHEQWRGRVEVVRDVNEALCAVGIKH